MFKIFSLYNVKIFFKISKSSIFVKIGKIFAAHNLTITGFVVVLKILKIILKE